MASASPLHADREVILCGGAINSPQVLMLSGIGDPQALRAHGIAVKVPLPGVGRNLQDHPAALLIYARGDKSPLLRNMRVDRLALGLIDAFALGRGFMTDLPGGITGFVQKRYGPSDAGHPALVHRRIAARRRLTCSRSANHLLTVSPAASCCCARRAAAPSRLPHRIRWRHRASAKDCLSTADDWKALRNGIALFRDIARRPELKPFIARELGPGPEVKTDAQLEDYVRRTAVTAHHPAGTCKMGSDADPMAVVDDRLRVRGTAACASSTPRCSRISLAAISTRRRS